MNALFDKIKRAVESSNFQPPLFSNSVSDHTATDTVFYVISRPESKKDSEMNTIHESNTKQSYPQNWATYNQAQTHEKALFQKLLFGLCREIDNLPRKNESAGRSRLPLSDMVFSVVYKTYETVSGRRFICDLEDAKAKGYISRVPHFNSIFNYLDHNAMDWILRDLITMSAAPLRAFETNFAVDASGFATGTFDRWYWAKYGTKGRQTQMENWIKCHLMCGTMTNIVTSVELTSKYANDTTQFPALVEATARDWNINHVTADKAYLSAKNFELVNDRGGMLFVPFKSNSVMGGKDRSEVWKTMYAYFHLHRAQFMNYYHCRSNVETTFSMIKGKFGHKLRSKTPTAQENEILCKVLCHNLCVIVNAMYELGIEPEFLG